MKAKQIYAKQTDTQTREMMTVYRSIKISTNNNAMLITVSVTMSMEFGMLYNYLSEHSYHSGLPLAQIINIITTTPSDVIK